MDFQIVFVNCAGERGSITRAGEEAFTLFATYSDLLLTGGDLRLDIPEATPGTHIIQVMIINLPEDPEEKSTPISSFYLACECVYPVNKEKRVQSKLIAPVEHIAVPQKRLFVPKGAVR